MADAKQVAEGFFDAWTGGDFERARGLLHDDVSFEGPIDSFSDAVSYLASLRQLSGIVTGAEKRKVFVDGDDVCVIYDLKTTPVPSSRTCEWYRVRDGRIASVSVISTRGRSRRSSGHSTAVELRRRRWRPSRRHDAGRIPSPGISRRSAGPCFRPA